MQKLGLVWETKQNEDKQSKECYIWKFINVTHLYDLKQSAKDAENGVLMQSIIINRANPNFGFINEQCWQSHRKCTYFWILMAGSWAA